MVARGRRVTRLDDQIYRITFDGSVAEEHGFVAMGGQADQVAAVLKDHYADDLPLVRALGAAIAGLAAGRATATEDRAERQPAGSGHPGPGPGAPDVPAADRRAAGAAAGRGGRRRRSGPGQPGAGGRGRTAAWRGGQPRRRRDPVGPDRRALSLWALSLLEPQLLSTGRARWPARTACPPRDVNRPARSGRCRLGRIVLYIVASIAGAGRWASAICAVMSGMCARYG